MKFGFWLAIAGLLPRAAMACPACAGRDGFNLHTALVLGSMILVPFLISGVVVQIVRRLESDDQP